MKTIYKKRSKPMDENEYLRLKVMALETMIEVAEKELGIDIKKKSSGNPSKPINNG